MAKRYRAQSIAELGSLMKAHTKQRVAILDEARERAARRALPKIKRRVPKASGELRESLTVRVTAKQVQIGSDAPHFLAVDQGSRPHHPPVEPLIAWATRMGFEDPEGAAWAIAKKIAEEGTEPVAFIEASRGDVLEALKAEVRDALARMP